MVQWVVRVLYLIKDMLVLKLQQLFLIFLVHIINHSTHSIFTRGGSYQIQIGNQLYPQLSLNASTNKAAFLQELRRSQGNLYDFKNSMSINSVEFGILENGAPSCTQPGKFYIGIDTTKLGSGSSRNLLNGSSSQNSPINVLLNIATATTAARNLNLVLNYDALIEIDPATSMVSARV